jgi:hypothetical protein
MSFWYKICPVLSKLLYFISQLLISVLRRFITNQLHLNMLEKIGVLFFYER